VVIFSQAGGMEIEEVASRSPELVLKEFVDPKVGWMPFQAKKKILAGQVKTIENLSMLLCG